MAKERTLPETLSIDFVICDNTVNRYGWRLLVEGIDLTNFNKNPVCCLQHESDELPIGKWSNLRVENSKLIGTLTFDENDDDAVEVFWKYKDGYMNAVSLRILTNETSSDSALMVAGQRYETITKSEMVEISAVTVPGQGNAVKLMCPDGTEYKLSLVETSKTNPMSGQKTVEQLNAEIIAKNEQIENLKKLNAEGLVALHKMRLNLSESECALMIKLALQDFDTAKLALEARTTTSAALPSATNDKETMARSMVKLHLNRGAISAPEVEELVKLAIFDYEGVNKLLSHRQGREHLNSFILGVGGSNQTATSGEDRSNWTYLDYYKKDREALMLMQTSEPEKFKALELSFNTQSLKQGIIQAPKQGII